MNNEEVHHEHGVRLVIIDGREYRIHEATVTVAELLALVDKSPAEWLLETEILGGDRVTMDGDSDVELRENHIAVFHTKRREHHHHHDHGCELTVVVNSDPVRVEVQRVTLLSAVVADVLEKAKTAGRDDDQWELKTESGNVLALALTVEGAGIECGSTLFLSLKAGAAGEAAGELLVDPSVSRGKFEAEVAAFRGIEASYSKRGIWLVRAEFPDVFVVFATPNSAPLYMLAFGALINFDNYDLYAPSVKIANPISQAPYMAKDLPGQAHLLRRRDTQAPAGKPTQQIEIDRYMQWHTPDEIPFLCHPGIREYHAHPAHTGDDWLLHRGREGNLARIVDLLFQFGSSKVVGFQVSPAIQMPLP